MSSLIFGPKNSPLSQLTIGELVAKQAKERGDKTAVVVSWQNTRFTYKQLHERSGVLAKAFLDAGLQKGECIGMFAGNRWEYIEALLGAARIGCPYVVLNTAYTPIELANAVKVSSKSMRDSALSAVSSNHRSVARLQTGLRGKYNRSTGHLRTYRDVVWERKEQSCTSRSPKSSHSGSI